MKLMPFHGIEDSLIPDAHHKLVYRFFISFSRFEYALKRAGYCEGNSTGVEPNWDKFSAEHRKKHDPSRMPQLKEAWEYFSTRPPRKMILNRGRIAWSEPQFRTNEPELTWLLKVVRTVRNNLFHGGKYPYNQNQNGNPGRESARDSTLLEHSLTILEACAAFDKDVEYHMRNP